MLYCSAKKIYMRAGVKIWQTKNSCNAFLENQSELALKLLKCDFKLSVSHENRVFKRFLKTLELTNCLSFERIRQYPKIYYDAHEIQVKSLPEY